MSQETINLIKRYYQAFNERDMETFLSLLSVEIEHDINQGKREVGIEAFKQFMDCMNNNYNEQVQDLVIMSVVDGSRAAAEFLVEGEYLKHDARYPKATGQAYRLSAGAFFEVKDNLICRITSYYNLEDWIAQVNDR